MFDIYDNMTARLRAGGNYLWPLVLRLIMFWEFWEAGTEKLGGKNWFADIPWADWQKGFPWPFSAIPVELNWFAATWGELIFAVMILLGLFTRFAARLCHHEQGRRKFQAAPSFHRDSATTGIPWRRKNQPGSHPSEVDRTGRGHGRSHRRRDCGRTDVRDTRGKHHFPGAGLGNHLLCQCGGCSSSALKGSGSGCKRYPCLRNRLINPDSPGRCRAPTATKT